MTDTIIMTADEVVQNRKKEIREVTDYLEKFIRNFEEYDRSKADASLAKESEGFLKQISIPEEGRNLESAAEEIIENVYKTSQYVSNPKYYAFVPNSASPYSIAGSIMTDVFNIYAGANLFSPGGAIIEKKLISWLGSLAGFPDTCGGIFTSGGSMSSLTGLIAARNTVLGEENYSVGTAYYSDQSHSSIRKGLMLMGLCRNQLREIPTDCEYRMRTDLLEEQIRNDIDKGAKPFLLVGSLGTTNTGSIDNLQEMGKIAERYNIWFHVDGAFGGSILFSEKYRHLANGLETADSLTWDLHKWGLQTYSCSCIIAKDRKNFVSTFAEHPEYLEDIQDNEHVDAWDLGIEMTRPARSIKLWLTLQVLGRRKIGEIIDRTFYNAEVMTEEIGKMPDWEVIMKPVSVAVLFRYAPKNTDSSEYDEINAEIVRRCNSENDIYLATTIVDGKRVIRCCMTNSSITDRDIKETAEYLKTAAELVSMSY